MTDPRATWPREPGSGPARRYEIEPEPDEAGRAAIAAALEQLAQESDGSRAPWAARARQEIVDDGIA